MSKLSLDRFLEFAQRSKLIEPERLEQVVSEWKRQATIAQLDDAGECATHLVEAGLLTHWQAHKLLEGRHRGFQLGKYKLLGHLGSGGMSSVYLAEHTLMHRLAAVKVLPQHRLSDASYVARFHLEGQSTAALDHPNIVRVYDLDSDGKIHYLVMEYIEGRDLEAIVAENGPMDPVTAADYVAQAAVGLEHAHQTGLVHRDVKPANLLVDPQGVVKILDMGLAKFAGARSAAAALVNDEQVLGTADFVAPEQTVNSNTVDCRADIYSLGCTLYFLLSGHPPFPFGNALQRMAAHQHNTPPSIALDRPETPAELVAICERMMAKSPADRYASVGDVHAVLTAWLASGSGALARNRSLAAAGHGSTHGGGPSGFVPLPDQRGGDSNIHGSQEPPRGDSPFADTDPNLHQATQRIPTGLGGNEPPPLSSSQSHVLHSELARMAEHGAGGAAMRRLHHRSWSPPRPLRLRSFARSIPRRARRPMQWIGQSMRRRWRRSFARLRPSCRATNGRTQRRFGSPWYCSPRCAWRRLFWPSLRWLERRVGRANRWPNRGVFTAQEPPPSRPPFGRKIGQCPTRQIIEK